jgi:hypothetical protein
VPLGLGHVSPADLATGEVLDEPSPFIGLDRAVDEGRDLFRRQMDRVFPGSAHDSPLGLRSFP